MKSHAMPIRLAALLLCGLAGAATPPVDFSKAYVVGSQSGVGAITLGGIAMANDSNVYTANFNLQSDYSLALSGGNVLATSETLLEQSVRNSVWTGTYSVGAYTYQTTLTFTVVQSGVAAGSVQHVGDAKSGSLDARIAGDIVGQYQLTNPVTGTLAWFDADRVPANMQALVNAKTPVQFILRMKRIGANSYANGDLAGWSYSREYRLTLDGTGGTLTGQVAVPPDTFGSTETGDNGTLTLARKQ